MGRRRVHGERGNTMKFIDWFAGVGGFRRGMELAGHECVGFCEFDKFATASYISMHLLTYAQRKKLEELPLKKRQKEILKDEYRNGEWYANDIRRVCADDIPKADCWCFGFPCQDLSVAGKQLGFQGSRSSLFFRVMYLVGQIKEEDKPTYLFIENVKNLLSVNGGWDFARLLIEMERGGYDAEWQVLNSKDFGVPQNRERCFIIGHLRGRSTAKVFPFERADGEDSIQIIGHKDGYRRNTQVFSPDGITETLDTGQGGGRGHHVALPCFIDLSRGITMTDYARCLKARYDNGVSKVKADGRGVAMKILNKDFKHQFEAVHDISGGCSTLMARDYKDTQRIAIPLELLDEEEKVLIISNVNPSGKGMNGNVYDSNGISHTLTTNKGEANKISIPVLTPDRAEKRKNGRRFKGDGEPMFTLTNQDRHGNEPNVCVKVAEATKKGYSECEVGVDSVNLSVPGSKTRRGRVGRGVSNTLDTSCNQGIFVQVSEELTVYAVWYEKYQCYIAIRKLTPRECFRLQGWSDDYFEKAQFVNSDSQLYKQAGNGVTVTVIKAIAERMKIK